MVEEITPTEFQSRLEAGERLQLLDVREAVEHDIVALPDSLWIPMAQIPARLAELDPDRRIVVICRSGMRSWTVANYLNENGFSGSANLSGGILRWASELDPDLATY